MRLLWGDVSGRKQARAASLESNMRNVCMETFEEGILLQKLRGSSASELAVSYNVQN